MLRIVMMDSVHIVWTVCVCDVVWVHVCVSSGWL